MPEAVLVSAVRTPVGRAPKGALSHHPPRRPCRNCVERGFGSSSGLDKDEIDDVILGCAQPEGEQGWNIAPLGRPARAGCRSRFPA